MSLRIDSFRSGLSNWRLLEAESIHVLRETAAQFERPVLLYSIGKDSSVMLHLARKAFYPAPLTFPLLHIDTGYEYPEMIAFRDWFVEEIGARLIVHTNRRALDAGANPYKLGTARCCGLLRTQALLDALREYGADAALGGARRDEERSRAKERVFSFRDVNGQWDPKAQRPELWSLYNGRVSPGEQIRVFPLSNWTEMDVWSYIERERIPIPPLYFAQDREVVVRGGSLIPVDSNVRLLPGERPVVKRCRLRSLGCTPCTGAIESNAGTVAEIIEELRQFRRSERENRAMDHDQDGSMELKKREGYF
ncbi:MAG TPA: sulfate adenylyltransferase subunit CysD [Bryobacteraceae bacterium]|jgi:sulfate adenylyltransferase subunit 2